MNSQTRAAMAAGGGAPTPMQIRMLHCIPARLGWDDRERREFIASRTGGKRSAKELTHREATLLIDLLLAMQRGEAPPTMRTDGATRAELLLAEKLKNELGPDRFDGLARRVAGGTALPAAPGRKVRALIQASKSILAREAGEAKVTK